MEEVNGSWESSVKSRCKAGDVLIKEGTLERSGFEGRRAFKLDFGWIELYL